MSERGIGKDRGGGKREREREVTVGKRGIDR